MGRMYQRWSLAKRWFLNALVLGTLLGGLTLPEVVNAQAVSPRQQLFMTAAQEFHVPASILMAVSYNQSRWQSHGNLQSVDGGYGLMDLRGPVAVPDNGKGSGTIPQPKSSSDQNYTLNQAAQLLHVSVDALKTNDADNIRGGAAVLAQDARNLNHGALPTTDGDWYSAIAAFSGATSNQIASEFADNVYAILQSGESLTTNDGQLVNLSATKNLNPNKQGLQALHLSGLLPDNNNGAECPATLNCRFIPAGYAQNSADPSDYGNYDHANRPNDMSIKYIIIHDTEGSYDSAINHFQDTTSYVSGNYIIRSSDGAITQMVRNEDVSWGAGDWYVNMHGINIEHEGVASDGNTWYTEAMYRSSATLVRYLAAKYNIPLDRQHIIGHDNVPTIGPAYMPRQHWDPGPFWDWNHYMALLHGVSDQTEHDREANADRGGQKTVTIAPQYSHNEPQFSDCQTGSCMNLPIQPSSAVFVRTQPSPVAPLMSDPYVHQDGSAGTNQDNDWGDVAATGQRFAWAGQQGDWTAIWYAGQKGWIYNPSTQPVAFITHAHTITPAADKTSIPVYGDAYPEASAYPSDGTVPVQALQPLYTMPAGQKYAANLQNLPSDYFYDQTINYSMPHDHMVVVGSNKFYQIQFNHRTAYVLASDVKVQW